MKINLTSYSIKSNHWDKNNDHVKNWILEVSKDRNKWEKIDEHKDESQLNKKYAIATFITILMKDFYRFVRLTQTGPNWHKHYHTAFSVIEFYGKLNLSKLI